MGPDRHDEILKGIYSFYSKYQSPEFNDPEYFKRILDSYKKLGPLSNEDAKHRERILKNYWISCKRVRGTK